MKPSSSSLFKKLKEDTLEVHQSLEQHPSMLALMEGTITEEQYNQLLSQNYEAYRRVEDTLSPETVNVYPKHLISSWIAKDISKTPDFKAETTDDDTLRSYGKIYVLLGSLLGGKLIAQKVKNCKAISRDIHHFYNGDDPSRITYWKNFASQLASQEFTPAQEEAIVSGAIDAFLLFKNVYTQQS